VIDRVARRTYLRLLRQVRAPAGTVRDFLRAQMLLKLQSVGTEHGAAIARVEPDRAVLLDGRAIPYAHLAISDFFAPQTQLARTAGCALAYDARGRYFRVAADAFGRTDRPGVYACGEALGVRGAAHARLSGALAVHAYLRDRGADEPAPAALLAEQSRLAAFAEALEEAMYAEEPAWACACERVPFAAVREAIAFGLRDLGSLKSVTRLGMGNCQGRYCEPVACRALAAARHPPIAPLSQKNLVRPALARALADA
jgi:NAD(P)H-nitrite reductase large subunit